MMSKIYLIDDSGTIRLSMEGVLQRAGHEVATAADGMEALETLKGGYRPDLIITDVHMPRLDGLSLIRQVRGLPQFRKTPILVLTTESQQEKREQARQNGATGWLVKPVSAEKMMEVLDKVLPGAA